jgi:excisionase family DNA binding protein
MANLLTKHEAAAQLSVGIRTLDRLRESGELRSIRVRGGVRFTAEAIEEYLRHQEESPRSPSGIFFCNDPDCLVHEVRIDAHFYGQVPATFPPMRCPHCQGPLSHRRCLPLDDSLAPNVPANLGHLLEKARRESPLGPQ